MLFRRTATAFLSLPRPAVFALRVRVVECISVVVHCKSIHSFSFLQIFCNYFWEKILVFSYCADILHINDKKIFSKKLLFYT